MWTQQSLRPSPLSASVAEIATIALGSVVAHLDRDHSLVQVHANAAFVAPKPAARLRGEGPRPSRLIQSPLTRIAIAARLWSMRTQHSLRPSRLSTCSVNGGGHCEISPIWSLRPSPPSASTAEVRNHRVGFGRRSPGSVSLRGSAPFGHSIRCDQAHYLPRRRRSTTTASDSVLAHLGRYRSAVQLHSDAAFAATKPAVRLHAGRLQVVQTWSPASSISVLVTVVVAVAGRPGGGHQRSLARRLMTRTASHPRSASLAMACDPSDPTRDRRTGPAAGHDAADKSEAESHAGIAGIG
jgi:hypothetical protein